MGDGHGPAPGKSPDRIEREAKAVAAVRNGMSQMRAAREFGIPQSTLSARLAWFDDPGREERIQEAEEQILHHTLVAAEAAQRELAKRAAENPELLTVKELVPIAGMSQDKLALRRQWGKGGAGEGAGVNVLAQALAQLGGSGSVTISVNQGRDAIDVTPVDGAGGDD